MLPQRDVVDVKDWAHGRKPCLRLTRERELFMRFAVAGFVLVLVLAIVGTIVLGSLPVKPPVEKVEQSVPDDHIPR